MVLNIDILKTEVENVVNETIERSDLKAGDIFVLGCSTSEIQGGIIGKNSNEEIGIIVATTALEICKKHGLFLAVQGCEHINRSLVVEQAAAEKYDLEVVSVVPSLHAGGACSLAAFKLFENPVMVEHIVAKAGVDIGDTFIGMHIKFVQVPLRLKQKSVGFAHVSSVKSRPKLIGGERAKYSL